MNTNTHLENRKKTKLLELKYMYVLMVSTVQYILRELSLSKAL